MTARESFALRRLEHRDVPACERVLRALPAWFGIEESNRAYLESLRRLPGAVAESGGEVVGFVALEESNPLSLEIHVMGVEPSRHRGGVGRELVRWSREFAAARAAHWLHVKTRGPRIPDPDYEKTLGYADDVANAALFLASDEGSFVSCHDLVVDGGRSSFFFERPRNTD